MIETQIVDSDFILVISGVRNSVGSLECDAEMICDVHESKQQKYTQQNSDAKEV